MLSSNRFQTSFLDFQICSLSKLSFSPRNYVWKFWYFCKYLKISEFSTFQPNCFSCGKLLLSSNRFWAGFSNLFIVKIVTFGQIMLEIFYIFNNTLKILGFWLFNQIFFSFGKLFLTSNRFRTGFSDFQIHLSSKLSLMAEVCSKFSIF